MFFKGGAKCCIDELVRHHVVHFLACVNGSEPCGVKPNLKFLLARRDCCLDAFTHTYIRITGRNR